MGSTGELFEGEPKVLPEPMARGSATYQLASDPAPSVRHLAGYEPFVEFCTGQGVEAAELAADPARLFRYLRDVAQDIAADAALKQAAGVFAGNALARARPDAEWTAYEGAPAMVGTDELRFEVGRLLDALREVDEATLQGFIAKVSEWAGDRPDAPMVQPQPASLPAARAYVRPVLPEATYYAEDGTVIPYGRRWGDGPPDTDSYSVTSHTERFAGLHLVARALINHLVAVYDVEVREDNAVAADLVVDVRDVVAPIRVTPRAAGAAPLTFVLTGFPGVVVHAGVLHDFPFPVCGCDACDETVLTEADRLERMVLSVVAGGYAERYPVGRRRWREYALTAFDGSGAESGKGEPGPIDEARLSEAEIQLRDVPGGWEPWPLRER
ncbi:hypothetical protein SAMN04489743_3786 [Pseudarthrobacter equi]|uniref:Uncharacterized protein n=2 Tax=Pseudarthrobacter equi TaxID=728066 RepID=A0A1H2BMQ3_9MICC|nr:hypothetical protein SAMN04489743_3786 [Pseudarthrobacter equi]